MTTGFVVAGGSSRRMGRDKALLPWQAATLLDHAISRLREACGSVRLLSGPELRYVDRGLPVDADILRDVGAIAGVHTALERSDGPALLLAVDLPHVPVALLRRLAELVRDFDAVVPISPGGPEPLCAAYGPACREAVRRALDRGAYKLTAFWPDVRVKGVGVAELATFGDPATLFTNLNTPTDYDRAEPD
ncbi:MAG TPA: molybdenum cofactor guanylyltransferase [Vicinamibacteria bacterium]|nr:molybdenum cofactor guanylyltransferase [Vicinamibacteria bacterium]